MDNKEKVFRFIQAYQWQHEMIPSHKEIAQACGLSTPTVATTLQVLEKRGWIRRLGRKNRAIQLIQKVDFADPDIILELLAFYTQDEPANS